MKNEKTQLQKDEKNYKMWLKKNKGLIKNYDFRQNEISTPYVEESFPYQKALADGVFQLDEKHYSKSVVFGELNYRLSLEEIQDEIGQSYKDFLNALSPEVHYQFSFINLKDRTKDLKVSLDFEEKEDGYQVIRKEYKQFLKQQFEKSNSGLKHFKIVTFTVEGENKSDALKKLSQAEVQLLNRFQELQVTHKSLNTEERLKIIHNFLNPTKDFEYIQGKTSKELIAPEELNFNHLDFFKLERFVGTSRRLKVEASEMEDDLLEKIFKQEKNLIVSIHLTPYSKQAAEKKVRRTNLEVKRMIVDENKKAVQGGYDASLIPQKLSDHRENIENTLRDFKNNEKYFETTILLTLLDETQADTEKLLGVLQNQAGAELCTWANLTHMQEEGLWSSLPFGVNKINPYYKRDFTTESIRAFMPFTNQDIIEDSPRAFYYGVNQNTHNLIMADRVRLNNPNGLYLGTPGSGKSFAAKREIVNAILSTNDDIIICDPEGEYWPMINLLGGTIIDLGSHSTNYMNPLDLNINYGDGQDPLVEKADFILSFMQLIRGKRELEPVERTIIDRCVPKIYQKFLNEPKEENLPILEDLYLELLKEGEKGKYLASELELYVYGSLNLFNHRTNVNKNNRIVCYDFRRLSQNLRHLAMFVIQDQVWNKISENRGKRFTQYYCDEFHVMLANPLTAHYAVNAWKRLRKWNGIPTGMTQNMTDLMFANTENIASLFSNTDFILLFNQKGQDREILKEFLELSDEQVKHISNSKPGTGLLIYNGIAAPFKDDFPKETELYKVMNTKAKEEKEE